jgi:hypothetical protein
MADITPKSLMLIGMAGESHIHLIYGEKIGDPRPIILTVTPEYVAHKTSKSLPIHPSEFAHCLDDYAEDLRKTALDCRDRGKTSAILIGTSMTEPKRSPQLVIGRFRLEGGIIACARYIRTLGGRQATQTSNAKAPSLTMGESQPQRRQLPSASIGLNEAK